MNQFILKNIKPLFVIMWNSSTNIYILRDKIFIWCDPKSNRQSFLFAAHLSCISFTHRILHFYVTLSHTKCKLWKLPQTFMKFFHKFVWNNFFNIWKLCRNGFCVCVSVSLFFSQRTKLELYKGKFFVQM